MSAFVLFIARWFLGHEGAKGVDVPSAVEAASRPMTSDLLVWGLVALLIGLEVLTVVALRRRAADAGVADPASIRPAPDPGDVRRAILDQTTPTIIHDINNRIGIMMAHAEATRHRDGADPANGASLEAILGAAEHVHGLTERLRLFCGGRVTTAVETDIAGLVESMRPTYEQIAGDLRVAYEMRSRPTPVVDPSWLVQVVTGMVIDLVSTRGDGRITISLAEGERIVVAGDGEVISSHGALPTDSLGLLATAGGGKLTRRDDGALVLDIKHRSAEA